MRWYWYQVRFRQRAVILVLGRVRSGVRGGAWGGSCCALDRQRDGSLVRRYGGWGGWGCEKQWMGSFRGCALVSHRTGNSQRGVYVWNFLHDIRSSNCLLLAAKLAPSSQ